MSQARTCGYGRLGVLGLASPQSLVVVSRAVTLLDRLLSPDLMLSVELRPPRMGQGHHDSMDAWFAMHAAVASLVASDTPLFLTDSAVGAHEEENLHHLLTNLDADMVREFVCPFVTTKHTLQYCDWYAARAIEAGCGALTVLGGDKHVGPPRCVPHGYLLRQRIRERFPTLPLGGWANPHQDPARQVGFLADPRYTGEFYLTQLVSHLEPEPITRFQAELVRQGVTMPGVWGVFFYRSGNPRTLNRLSEFFPVPVDAVVAEFASGVSPEEVCARTIRHLRGLGIDKIYVSNLHPERAVEQLAAIRALL